MKEKQRVTERYLGTTNQQGDITVGNFRPTKSQQLLLINIGELLDSGRENIKEQDILNLPDEKLSQYELTISNLEGAFEILKRLGIIESDEEDNCTLSDLGNQVLDTIRQHQATEPTPGGEMPGEMPGEQQMGMPGGEMPMSGAQPAAQPGDLNMDLESLDLISFLNQKSKFLKG